MKGNPSRKEREYENTEYWSVSISGSFKYGYYNTLVVKVIEQNNDQKQDG